MRPLRAALPFPLAGISEAVGYHNQPPLTTAGAQNVRGFDPTTGRGRGGQRAGHSKYLASQPNGSNAIQYLDQVTVASAVSGASIRTQYGLCVAGGNVYQLTSSAATLATNGSGALSSTSPYVFGANLFGSVYFADGVSTKYWTGATNTVSSWTASAGSLPVNGGSNYPRLIVPWRTRIVQAALLGDAHNWFMSAMGDPDDWDYASGVSSGAVAGNNSDAGVCGDVITSLMPFNDDVLVFGCDHSLWRMQNDPADGGTIDLLSSVTGAAFGRAWCMDPQGLIYFWGSRGGLYRLAPDGFPEPLSIPVRKAQADVNLAVTIPRLVWDDLHHSVQIYLTPTSSSAGTHWCYDTLHKAWWKDTFTSNGHQPTAVHVFDGDAAGDRVIQVGCKDGYVRKLDVAADDDDGQAISSFVWLGPIHAEDWTPCRWTELSLALGSTSEQITYAVHAGRTAAEAFASTARFSGTWTATRSWLDRNRAVGSAFYLKLSNATVDRDWQYEDGDCVLTPLSPAEARPFR